MAAGIDDDGFVEAGAAKSVPADNTDLFAKDANPWNDSDFVNILKTLQGYHVDLLKIQDKLADNPVQAGEYQGKLRLEVNKLFAYMNAYIDLQVDISEDYARTRQNLYETGLKSGKSPSAAEKHAGEMTRILASNLAIAKFRVDQIKNEYERYNGIAIYLATRMKEFNSERMMG